MLERPQDPVLKMISGEWGWDQTTYPQTVDLMKPLKRCLWMQPPPTLPAQQDNHGLSQTSPSQDNYRQLHESPTVQLQIPQHSNQMTTEVHTATNLQQLQWAARQNATLIILQNSSVPHPSYSAPIVPVNIQLPQYNGTTSIVQWWMSFMAYLQLYRMDEHQAINLGRFYCRETSLGFHLVFKNFFELVSNQN